MSEFEDFVNANFGYNVEGYDDKADYDQKINACNEAIRLDPNNVQAYELRGIAYGGKGDNDRAIADFSEAIRINPEEAIYYRRRGQAYGEKGDYVQAIADLNEAVRLDENYMSKSKTFNSGGPASISLKKIFSMSYHDRGFVYGKMKKYKQAIADFEKALELRPDDETYRNNLEWAKNANKRSNKLIWSIVGAVIGAIIGGVIGGGYGVFLGAIIGAFPIPIIKFIGRWLSK